MLDPIERIESRIDDLITAQFGGVPEGFIRCYDCKRIVPLEQVESADARPDAPAICFDCLEKRGVKVP